MNANHADFWFLITLAIGVVLVCLPWFLITQLLPTSWQGERPSETKASYQRNQWVYRIVSTPGVALLFRGYPDLLLSALSELAERLEDPSSAIRWERLRLERCPPVAIRAAALRRISYLLRQQGEHEQATRIEAALQALPPPPDDASTAGESLSITAARDSLITARITVLMAQGRLYESLETIEQGQVSEHSYRRALLARPKAEALRRLGRYDEAIAAFRHLIAFSDLLQARAQAKDWSGISSKNNYHLNKAFKQIILPSQISTSLGLLRLYLESGKLGAATECWEALPPEKTRPAVDASCYAIGAWLFARQGKVPSARLFIREADRIGPPDSIATVGYPLAQALRALGDYDGAISRWQRLITMSTDKPFDQAEYRTYLADCYAKSERYEDARQAYEQVIAAGFPEAAFTAISRERLKHFS